MRHYADTSFLFSYYGSDANSPRADAWRQSHPVPLPLTPLHRLELRNALQLAVFRKSLAAHEVGEIWRTVESDVRAGLLAERDFGLDRLFHDAETLAANHTSQIGTRSLDILHATAALLLGIEEFATFDQRQQALATRAWLRVVAL